MERHKENRPSSWLSLIHIYITLGTTQHLTRDLQTPEQEYYRKIFYLERRIYE